MTLARFPRHSLLRRISSPLVASALLAGALFALQTSPAEALDPNTDAIVRADGDCLRLRAQPTTSGATLTCIAEGSTVRILAGTVTLDGFRWQRISFGGQEGWSVEQYLVAAGTSSPPPAAVPPAATPTPSAPPAQQPIPTTTPAPITPAAISTLSGTVPAGGFGLAVWSGGPIDRIPSAASPTGCLVRAIWQTRGGEFVGYVYGAPGIVNSTWNAQFADGTLPANTAIILVCGGGASTPPPTSGPPTSGAPPAAPGLPPGTPATPPGPAGNG